MASPNEQTPAPPPPQSPGPSSPRSARRLSVAESTRSRTTGEDSSSASTGSHTMPVAVTPPLWTHRVSASFNAMADQIAAASQAIALIPPLPDTMFAALSARLDAIEQAQERLQGEFTALSERLTQIDTRPDKSEKALEEQIAAFKLEQMRLPARLHNSTVTVSKLAIKPIVMANGKPPPQFPSTRGEFEHLTKERYEFMLTSYGLPITGNTAAKRDVVRSFIGLPEVVGGK